MPSVSPLLLAIAGASLVSAHGYVNKITVGGEEYEGWNPGAKSPMDGIAWQESVARLGEGAGTYLRHPLQNGVRLTGAVGRKEEPAPL